MTVLTLTKPVSGALDKRRWTTICLLELDREVASLGAGEVVLAVSTSVAVDGGLGTAVEAAAVVGTTSSAKPLFGRKKRGGRDLHITVDLLVEPQLVVGGTVLLDGEGEAVVSAGVGAVVGQGRSVVLAALEAVGLEGDGLKAIVVADGDIGDLDGGGGDGEADEESGGGEELHFDWVG